MNCYNNPQGFARVPVTQSGYNTPVTSNAFTPASPYTDNTYLTPASTTTANDNLYMSATPWGSPVAVNPQEPSSPLSVQPNGSGTPFVGAVDPAPLPETLTQSIYTPGYLQQYVGSLMRVEFLIGGQTTDRVGYLREVGASYIVLESVDYGNLMMCDLYSIKFATILRSPLNPQIASLYEDQ